LTLFLFSVTIFCFFVSFLMLLITKWQYSHLFFPFFLSIWKRNVYSSHHWILYFDTPPYCSHCPHLNLVYSVSHIGFHDPHEQLSFSNPGHVQISVNFCSFLMSCFECIIWTVM
jgi:hypothetical protein